MNTNEKLSAVAMEQSCKSGVMVSASFELFKDDFLSAFIFKPIKRPNFNEFLNAHFKAYSIIYKNIYSVVEYSKIAIKEDPNEFKNYGIELKHNNCKHENIISSDGLGECLDCGVRNY